MSFEYSIEIKKTEDKLSHSKTVDFYPIGRLLNWHEGVHIAEKGHLQLKQLPMELSLPIEWQKLQ